MKKLLFVLSLVCVMGVVASNAQDKKPAAKNEPAKTEQTAKKTTEATKKEAKAPAATAAKPVAKPVAKQVSK